jgi:Na+/proline symporter
VASLVFLVTRNLSDGLRLFLTALALNIAVGVDMVTCIVVTGIATAIYTFFGGVRSVVWNDCIQFGVYMLGAVAASYVLLSQLPGGWDQLIEFGTSTGRFRLFDFDLDLTKSSVTFWSGLVGGAFLTLATHGADHLIVQRYLCAKSQSAAGWALGLSGFVVLAQFALFLFIGVQIACFYAAAGAPASSIDGDEAFMTFVMNHMGTGMKGLILAAVLAAAMSTLASSLNSSASSLTNDWLGRYLQNMDDRRSLALSRMLTLVFGLVQMMVALATHLVVQEMTIVAAVLKIAGFASGLLLGLYALGLFAPRATERSALAAFVVGTLVTCGVAFGTPLSGWWYALVGSTTIFVVGWSLGYVLDPPRQGPTAALGK